MYRMRRYRVHANGVEEHVLSAPDGVPACLQREIDRLLVECERYRVYYDGYYGQYTDETDWCLAVNIFYPIDHMGMADDQFFA